MTEVSSLLLMVLGELLIVTTVISVGMIVHYFIKKSRDRSAVNSLIARVKEDASRRSDETRKMIGRYGLEGESLNQVSAKIARDEKVFYQRMINLYLQRNSDALQNFNVDFETSVETYRTIEISLGEASSAQSASDATVDTSEIDRLVMDNERLSEELKITMDTMGRMLSEYSSMFADGPETDLSQANLVQMPTPDAAPIDSADSTVDLSASSDIEGAVDTDLEQLKGLLDEDDAQAVKDLLGEPDDEQTVEIEKNQTSSLDDELDPVALTDEDLADFADMDQTIVVDPGEDDLDADSIDALINSHMDPK